MAATLRAIAVAWFRAEDYERIREISDDEMVPVFAEWEAKMTARCAQVVARYGGSVIVEKVVIDPQALRAFARQFHAGKIDTQVRSEFAARLLAEKYGTDH